MKKVLAVLLTVCVVFVAGAAFAQQGRNNNCTQEFRGPQFNRQNFNGQRGNFQNSPANFEGCSPDFGPRNGNGRMGGMNFTPDMPKEIREKAADLAKLRIDLEEALSSRPVNKAKALDVHSKMQKIQNEIDTWRFQKRLERIEEFQEKRELNKKAQDAPEK
ncbi:MAG: hypothetical protein IKN30_08900 [Synergistaceae bacterium]|nr:hypothetical protein [Synergistaceae bacterium]